jgi:hypothetical protein
LPGTATYGEYRQRATKALSGINSEHSGGASQRLTRALILNDPPTFDSGEITEKGSLNARLIRERRRELIVQMHDDTDNELIVIRSLQSEILEPCDAIGVWAAGTSALGHNVAWPEFSGELGGYSRSSLYITTFHKSIIMRTALPATSTIEFAPPSC